MASVAIIGAGITGLVAARCLARAGMEPTVYEAAQRSGGLAHSVADGQWCAEYGPNTIAADAQTVEFLHGLGLKDVLVEAQAASRKRYLVKDGMPVAMPGSPPSLFSSSLFSRQAKWALLREPWVKRLALPAPSTDSGDDGSQAVDESVAAFVRRRLGDEWLERAVSPFISGVFAGDPEKLSLRHALPRMMQLESSYGSLIRGAIRKKGMGARKLYSTPQGLAGIARALARPIESLHLGRRVSALQPTRGMWVLDIEGEKKLFDHVILAVDADAAASLVAPWASDVAGTLRGVEAPPLAVVHHGYSRRSVAHPLDGFGMLIPRVEGIRTLGTLFPSSMFTSRAPEGSVLLTSFLGGMLDPAVADEPVDTLRATVIEEHRALLGIKEAPVWSRAYVVRRSIPQYNLGYGRVIEAMQSAESNWPGMWLRGNYVGGVALPDRIAAGRDVAERILGEDGK